MSQSSISAGNKANPLGWLSVIVLLSAAALRIFGPDPLHIAGNLITNSLPCHTLILLGLSMNVASMLSRPDKQRYAWVPVPILIIYAVLLGKDWLGLLI